MMTIQRIKENENESTEFVASFATTAGAVRTINIERSTENKGTVKHVPFCGFYAQSCVKIPAPA
jgi:hypothetical protein